MAQPKIFDKYGNITPEFSKKLSDRIKDENMHPEKYRNRLSPSAKEIMELKLKVAQWIYWPIMIISSIFKGAVAVWIVATIIYIMYIINVQSEAKEKSKEYHEAIKHSRVIRR